MANVTLDGFAARDFSHGGATRTVYRMGAGPGVVLMHEIPGITPEAIALAGRLAAAGFTVDMPHLFGDVGRPFTAGYMVGQLARSCVRREFAVFAGGRSSPITEWLRALCRDLHADVGGRGVGAIGMCITGNFALAMMVEPALMAPILSQPSLPFAIVPGSKRHLHVSPEELATARRRVAEEGLRVLGLRFTGDLLCPGDRFAHLSEALGEGFEPIEIDSSSGNMHGIGKRAHSVLTMDFVDRAGHPTRAAMDRVIGFLREHLGAPDSN